MKYHYNPNIKAAVRKLAAVKRGRYQVAIYLKTKHQDRKQRSKAA